MNVESDRASPLVSEKGQRRFFRQVICDAQLELSRLESVIKIMEATLLTAMGSLGIKKGFIGKIRTDGSGSQIVNRGMETETIAFVEDNLRKLRHHYFPSGDAAPHNLHVDIHIIPSDPRQEDPLSKSQLRLLINWRLGRKLTGLFGLGEKINAAPFTDIENDLLYGLTDHMMMAMNGIDTKSIIHTLENELDQARKRAADTTAIRDATRKELEETLFRLSGFNDIFYELSDIKESNRVIDAFLLVLLGIFSAGSGFICYREETTGNLYSSARGSRSSAMEETDPDRFNMILDDIFHLPHTPKIGVMQAAIISSDQLNRFSWMTNNPITLLFQIDETAKGMICLGKRLVPTEYGPREQELILAFTHNFLIFLKNSRSFETIQRLHREQEHKNIELEKSVRELTSCRTTIDGMEKSGERIKSAISKAAARTQHVSVMDIVLIIVTGIVLGLIYNLASPSGISVIPETWRHAPTRRINVLDAKTLVKGYDAILIDARPIEFYNQNHIDGALNLPQALFEFVYMMRFGRIEPEKPMVVYGRTISRHYDETVAHQLTERGHRKVYVLTGGLKAWQSKP